MGSQDSKAQGRVFSEDLCDEYGGAGSYYLLARAWRSEGHTQEADAAMQCVVQLHTSALDAEKHALKDAAVVGAR